MNFKIKLLWLLAVFAGVFIISSYTMISCSNSLTSGPVFPEEDYTQEWEKVDSLVNLGLPQSALEIVENIYAEAKEDHNSPQFIKAVLYKMRLISDFEEDFMEKIIADVNEEISQASFPDDAILNSIQAELYWRYYEMNRYKILGRTTVVNSNLDDLATWDLNNYVDHVIKHYLNSIEKKQELKNIPLKSYDVILITQENSKKYRPTLFDFLAHRALEYFMDEEPGVTEPVYKFVINSPDYFKPIDEFTRLNITSKDTMSLKYYALDIMQELLAFHENDENPEALIEVDLQRLKFVKNQGVVEYEDSLYIESMKYLLEKYKEFPSSVEISYEIAQGYYTQGQQYDPAKSEKFKWDLKDAKKYCEDAIEKYPDAPWTPSCKQLIQIILEKSVSVTADYVSVKDSPILGLLSYSNTTTVTFRIIRMDPDEDRDKKQKMRKNELISWYLDQPVVEQWGVDCPDDGDYQDHATEVKIPSLPFGYYIILAGTDQDLSMKEGVAAYTPFWVSNISFISRGENNGNYDFYVLDRDRGDALSNVSVESFYREYDYNSRSYVMKPWRNFTTDENGFFNIASLSGQNRTKSFILKFTSEDDMLITENYFYMYPRDTKPPKFKPKTFFFTDRAIYRPGQTIYFKGIILETDGKENSIMPDYETTITFYDVNRQKISELELVTNDYGSFNGSFIAPQGVLPGRMTISNKSGSVNVQVEEYKRPKFEVLFEPVKGEFKLNENIKVDGNAKAYAGSNIDNATVKYRVVRKARFPYRGYWYRGWWPQSPEMEITNGVTNTDENGEFNITFAAFPDLSIPEKQKPVFYYTIYADVTDINGETQSGNTSVGVGYTALEIDVEVPSEVNQLAIGSWQLVTKNLNGEKTPALVAITVHMLVEPERIFRSREWQKPDKFVMTKEEFYEAFPYDVYNDEDNVGTWEKDNEVYNKQFNTEMDSVLKFDDLTSWKQGYYVLTANTEDKFGEEVEVKKYFVVFSPEDKKPPVYSMNWYTVLKGKGEPGENAKVLFGTMEKDVNVIYEVIHEGKIVSREWLNMKNQQTLFEIPITEEYRGNFGINFAFIKHNRAYQNSTKIEVPYTNKEVDFEWSTFRNKLLPGQEEQWSLKIKDKMGEKITAEMLASMYDASLDAFMPHNWYFDILKYYQGIDGWDVNNAFTQKKSQSYTDIEIPYVEPVYRDYDHLNWFGFDFYHGYYRRIGGMALEADTKAMAMPDDAGDMEDMNEIVVAKVEESETGEEPPEGEESPTPQEEPSEVQVRRSFQETAFFYPDLHTDENGDIVIKFTIPESLTRWKMMGFAFTKDLKYGFTEKEVVTQKDLMVMPNAPRFFREGDQMVFSSKISNLSENELSGTATIEFFNAVTMQPVDLFSDDTFEKNFTVRKGMSDAVSWNISIPEEGIQAITYRIIAKAENFSDGEEMALPVLTNRMLVTETLPLPIRGEGTKTFTFEKLIDSESSSTLKNFKLTLEFTSNPAWYAVQALPYLMEYPYECSEQIFSRYYANSIATYIVNSNPKIKRVFDTWKNYAPDALLSNLEKNQELKALILEETPWVLEAEDESERKQRIALLFDLNKMSSELSSALLRLQNTQLPNGGWPWFKGMEDNRYITQHIIAGFGHLDHLKIKDLKEDQNLWRMVKKAVLYLDDRITEDYQRILKYYEDDMDKKHTGYMQIHYLYARSFFTAGDVNINISKKNMEAFNYFEGQIQKYWLEYNKYMQGMISLALYRFGDNNTPDKIIASLKEHALHSEEMGMYWRTDRGYFWYEAPIETQALMIEAFNEVAKDEAAVEDMKVWLLKQKQTQDWETTKATVEAVYALLLTGTDMLASDELVTIKVGDIVVDPANDPEITTEAGTGYFKTSWSGGEIIPDLGHLTVTKNDKGVAWGGLYWQYFEDLDKITPHETPLSLVKKLFVERQTSSGPVLEPLMEKGEGKLEIGDKIKVRIELRVDRDMEYVHMKDMRAAALEPVNVISGYRYQGGLGYYESTRDASTNFFFGYLPKGTYVFEYPLIVSQEGDFSNGITTIQCMYAPEFASHSEGVRLRIN